MTGVESGTMSRGARALRAAAARRPAVGCFVFSRDAAITDLAGLAGMDFVILDMEHAGLGHAEVAEHVRAAHRSGIAVLVRIPGSDAGVASRVLDAGADGLVIPHFGLDPDADQRLMQGVRYAPDGSRAACSGVAAAAYGLAPFPEVAAAANRHLFLMPQIEDASVVPGIEDLLARHRVDALMPGPSDLAASFGRPGHFDDPQVVAALEAIALACARRRIPLGHYLVDPVAPAPSLGAAILVYSIDYRILGRALRSAVQALRSNAREEQ